MSVPLLLYKFFPWKEEDIENHYNVRIPSGSYVEPYPKFTSMEFLCAKRLMMKIISVCHDIVDKVVFFGYETNEVDWCNTGWVEKILSRESVSRRWLRVLINNNYVVAVKEYAKKHKIEVLLFEDIPSIVTMDMYNLLFNELKMGISTAINYYDPRCNLTEDHKDVIRHLYHEKGLRPKNIIKVTMIEEFYPIDKSIIEDYIFGSDIQTDIYLLEHIQDIQEKYVCKFLSDVFRYTDKAFLVSVLDQRYRDLFRILHSDIMMKGRSDCIDLFLSIFKHAVLGTHEADVKWLFNGFFKLMSPFDVFARLKVKEEDCCKSFTDLAYLYGFGPQDKTTYVVSKNKEDMNEKTSFQDICDACRLLNGKMDVDKFIDHVDYQLSRWKNEIYLEYFGIHPYRYGSYARTEFALEAFEMSSPKRLREINNKRYLAVLRKHGYLNEEIMRTHLLRYTPMKIVHFMLSAFEDGEFKIDLDKKNMSAHVIKALREKDMITKTW
jgi:hypothetical protein